MNAAPSPRVQQALLALAQSRLALHAELLPAPQTAARQGRPGAIARLWWRRLRSWPAMPMLGEALHQWWRRHPLQPLGEGLVVQARTQVWPLVRRHPWAGAGVAAALGAAVAAARPWRWDWVDRQVRRAPGAASGWLLRQLTSAPVQATLAASLLAMQRQDRRSPVSDAVAPHADGPPGTI